MGRRYYMMDLRKRFESALKDTVNEWKDNPNVKGIFVYGSFARGTATADSDLDICVVWDADEAPVRLMSTHKEVRIDMSFMTLQEVDDVLDGTIADVLRISRVISRLRGARVMYDSKNLLTKWQQQASEYVWSDGSINLVRTEALEHLDRAGEFVQKMDETSAIHEMREGLFRLGRVILMTNNIFRILKPAEVLTEVRLLNPLTYKVFLRTYKLRGMNESKLLAILQEMKAWFDTAESRLEKDTREDMAILATTHLAQAQREYYGSMVLTYAGDYELAMLEMRQAAVSLGRALVTLHGKIPDQEGAFIKTLRDSEGQFYKEILLEHGAYDIQLPEIKRIVAEAQFIAHRI
jgi:predicted nucleotidyltransferase